MEKIKLPKTITLRLCPLCHGRQTWTVHGFAYPAGDDSNFKCYKCGREGKPLYLKYYINPLTQEEYDNLQYAMKQLEKSTSKLRLEEQNDN